MLFVTLLFGYQVPPAFFLSLIVGFLFSPLATFHRPLPPCSSEQSYSQVLNIIPLMPGIFSDMKQIPTGPCCSKCDALTSPETHAQLEPAFLHDS